MTLREQQSRFVLLVAELIQYAYSDPRYDLTFGEAYRTKEQQALYVQAGKSQTMRSKHLTRLAIDLQLFIDGVYQQGWKAYEPLGHFWKSLDPGCTWGGDWVTLRDAVHFEYSEPVPTAVAQAPTGRSPS
jgi:hypothetical protein